MPAAVVFDCDGVLVDSEPHSRDAWLVVLAELGHPGTAADIAACTGLGFEPTRQALTTIAPLPTAGEIWPRLFRAIEDSFRAGLRVFEDAALVMKAAAEAGIPLAVASSSPRRRLDLTLEVAGLGGGFVTRVAGDEVGAHKPAPDAYLLAAELLGVSPGRCVAVEDSGPGAEAATSAGMRTVGVVRDEDERAGLVAAGADVVDRLTARHVLGVAPGAPS